MENIKLYNLNKVGFIINADYNSLNKLPGIYVYIFKLNNNKLYIGSATNLAQRFTQHRYICFAYNKSNNNLYSLVKKYGWENLEWKVL